MAKKIPTWKIEQRKREDAEKRRKAQRTIALKTIDRILVDLDKLAKLGYRNNDSDAKPVFHPGETFDINTARYRLQAVRGNYSKQIR